MFQLLATMISAGRSSIPSDLDIDGFIDRLQRVLVNNPYSGELQRLKQFAVRNADPEFAKVLTAKCKLYEQQQKQMRPTGAVGESMYRLEKALGYIVNSRGAVSGVLLALTSVIGGMFLFLPPRVDSVLNAYGDELVDPFSIKLDSPRRSDADESIDSWMQQQLLLMLRKPEIQHQFLVLLEGADQREGGRDLSHSIERITRCVEKLVPRIEFQGVEEKAVMQALLTSSFAADLAKDLSDSGLEATDDGLPRTDAFVVEAAGAVE